MAIPDYVRFDHGHPLTEKYAGEWFESFDLFGYFERFAIQTDGTVWLTPTQVIPSEQLQADLGAPELIKIKLAPVRILLSKPITIVGETCTMTIEFSNGVLTKITACQ